MEDFVNVMNIIFDALKTDFSLYGFTFSLWDVFMLILICSVVVTFLKILWNI